LDELKRSGKIVYESYNCFIGIYYSIFKIFHKYILKLKLLPVTKIINKYLIKLFIYYSLWG